MSYAVAKKTNISLTDVSLLKRERLIFFTNIGSDFKVNNNNKDNV